MHKLIATAHLMGITLQNSVRKKLQTEDAERGSHTVEVVIVLAILAAIAIAAGAALRAGVLTRIGEIFG
ncbi:hypothetical protein ACQFYA_21030 [Promicromonospora sp. Marseille-Q5078]